MFSAFSDAELQRAAHHASAAQDHLWDRQLQRHPEQYTHSCGRTDGTHHAECLEQLNNPLYCAVSELHTELGMAWFNRQPTVVQIGPRGWLRIEGD